MMALSVVPSRLDGIQVSTNADFIVEKPATPSPLSSSSSSSYLESLTPRKCSLSNSSSTSSNSSATTSKIDNRIQELDEEPSLFKSTGVVKSLCKKFSPTDNINNNNRGVVAPSHLSSLPSPRNYNNSTINNNKRASSNLSRIGFRLPNNTGSTLVNRINNFNKSSPDSGSLFELKKSQSVLVLEETNMSAKGRAGLEPGLAKSNNYLSQMDDPPSVNNKASLGNLTAIENDSQVFEKVNIKERISQFLRNNPTSTTSSQVNSFRNSNGVVTSDLNVSLKSPSTPKRSNLIKISVNNKSTEKKPHLTRIDVDEDTPESNKPLEFTFSPANSMNHNPKVSTPTMEKKFSTSSMDLDKTKYEEKYLQIMQLFNELKRDNESIENLLNDIRLKVKETTNSIKVNLEDSFSSFPNANENITYDELINNSSLDSAQSSELNNSASTYTEKLTESSHSESLASSESSSLTDDGTRQSIIIVGTLPNNYRSSYQYLSNPSLIRHKF